jgi:hypothetical protein
VLKKHGDFRREFAINGAVNLTINPNFTDQDGDDWGLVTTGTPSFDLSVGGVAFDVTGTDAASILINPRTFIPGLRPRDQLWILFRVVDITLTGNGASFGLGIKRNIAPGYEQTGLWRYLRSGGNPFLNPLVAGESSTTSFSNQQAAVDALLSINVSGLLYEYRKQGEAQDFPTTPDPDDISLFTASGFNGRFASKLQAEPVNADIDILNEVISVAAVPDVGTSVAATLSDVWVYRLE